MHTQHPAGVDASRNDAPEVVVVELRPQCRGSVAPKSAYEPLPPDWRERLAEKWPDGTLLTTAWSIAKDVDALGDLLAGRTVGPDRLRIDEVERARRATHVRLVSPLDAAGLGWAA